MSKPKKENRNYKNLFLFLFAITIGVLYSMYVGTLGMFTKEYSITNSKLPKDFYGLKIIHISDLHYGDYVNESFLKKLVAKINAYKPDIVIYTGDLYKKFSAPVQEDKVIIINYLSKIISKYGNYYVKGNHDRKGYEDIMNAAGFYNLNEKEDIIYGENNNQILLIASNNAKKYLDKNKDISGYKILVMHKPDDILALKDYNFELALAGHSHNGQINIPYIKELYMPKGSKTYNKPYYKVNNTDLYISSGLGTSLLNLRLFSHPSFNLYRITNK
ncbi:MAG TPA: metallophosphoesterase [Bacilli bacterium]|nr:metallophosphoesterase [Bacilli bacterium]